MTEETETYTQEEVMALTREIQEQKQNQHSFFTNVVKTPDSTKVGNLDIEELGNAQITLRGAKELQIFCEDVWDNQVFADYFKKIAEATSATSLSKEGFLMKLSVTSTKQLADITKQEKKNKGWFKKE